MNPLVGSDVKISIKDDQDISNLLWERIKRREEVEGAHSWTEGSGIQNRDAVDPWTIWRLGALTPCRVKNPGITSQLAISVSSSIFAFNQLSVVCSTYLLGKKTHNPYISGSTPFKPVLFKGQLLYIKKIPFS